MKLPSILVMMSTYNGENYICEQIDSILQQENVDVHLLIRDDGSKDKTAFIIQEYAKNYENVECILGDNIGFRRSFFNTLISVGKKFDYYAFSDQDDVWMRDKLITGIRALMKSDNKIALYASALRVVDQNLTFMYNNTFDKLRVSFGSALSRQRLAGCTMVISNELFQKCKSFEIKDSMGDTISHDAAVYYICLALGGNVIFDPIPKICFRRHIGTVTEHGKGVMSRIESVTNIFSKTKNRRLKQVLYIYSTYKDQLDQEVSVLCNQVLHYQDSVGNTIRLAFNRKIRCGLITADIINFVAILARCY